MSHLYSGQSDHIQCIRVSFNGHFAPSRTHLNPTQLLATLSTQDAKRGAAGAKKGKKRALEQPTQNGPRKRSKASATPVSGSPSDSDWALPAYKHVFNLRYTTACLDAVQHRHYIDSQSEAGAAWLQEEEELVQWLLEHADPDETTMFDLGSMPLMTASMHMPRSDGVYVRAPESDGSLPLLSVPILDPSFSLDDHDFHTARCKDLVDPHYAFLLLSQPPWTRCSIEARLSLRLPPKCAIDGSASELPFTLQLEIECALNFPRMLQPIAEVGKDLVDSTRIALAEEAQRRLLLLLFPSNPRPLEYRGTTDIPLLYSVLGPAPALDVPGAEDALQPELLNPTLLPFQRRSVGWMLGREGRTVSESGAIVPKGASGTTREELPLFWDKVHVDDDHTVYVNRVRGILSLSPPDAEEDARNADALGGIVAEEPGLGKTLECITLTMLNPAPDRTPENKRWDPEAKVDVKEIKTTLIVTPPALASQWVDEFAAHAPHLKVLVYDGWQKVPVPISEQDAEVEREKRRAKVAKAAKSKAKASVPKAKAKKATKGKGKAKTKGKAKEEDSDIEMAAESAEDKMEVDAEEPVDDVLDWCQYVNTFDVCITTYNVLQQDLSVARPPPVRPRRKFVQYSNVQRSRSPLVMCEWYRVIMDEVQMVGGGRTEEMVSLIPRLASWAVSGTPARSQVADLIHALKFLRVAAITETPRAWTRLLLPGYVSEFVDVFRRYSVRTMKAAVKDELTIPPQTRYLVPIEVGRVERHVYDQNMESALLELGLDARGVAATENWEVDVTVLRSWLRRLRGLCTHPQVGQLQAHADKLHKPGVLKTMGEVLEGMTEQNWRNLMDDRRSRIQTMTALAQLLQQDSKNRNRYRQALDVLLLAEKDVNQFISDINAAIEEHAKIGDALKAEAAAVRQVRKAATAERDAAKGKERARSASPTPSEFDHDEEGLPKNIVGAAHITKKQGLNSRLREARIVLHKVQFLKGDVYHVLGATYAVQEGEAYTMADDLRKLLLKGTEEAAQQAMTYLDRDKVVKSLKESDLYVKVPFCPKGGIKSAHLMEEADELIDGLLNAQSELLWAWRTKLIALLTQPLGSNGDDADGQEYSRSIETQGEAESYLQAYSALLADRRETLIAERTLLAAHDVREVKARKTKASRKAQAAFFDDDVAVDLDRLDDTEVMPEHQVLLKTLNDERKALLDEYPGKAITTVRSQLNKIATAIVKVDDPEKLLAKDGATQLNSLIAKQSKLNERLQEDLAHLRKAFNERVSYFRQLQEISDTVAEAMWEGGLQDAIEHNKAEQTELETRINASRARQRYLEHLAKTQEEGTLDEDDKSCILCKCDFLRGYITQCAHVFCEDCMKAWMARPEGKTCPVCRVPMNPDQLQRFSIGEADGRAPNAPARILNGEAMPQSRRQIQYNFLDPRILQDIQTVESIGSYGSKIQTLVQHLLYLQLTDPGAKSIIFSAWADSLHIIQHALRANDITCLRIDQNSGKENAAKRFRANPDISVLLLHGERENAGLNVTCASRVFLVESVVHHAFEVQAIARIDRMGQTKPTEVYCYYAEETVERNILDLAARQGQSLYTRENAAGTLSVTPFAVDGDKTKVDAPTKKVQKGDFVYKTDDMLAIFFPHMFEDVEYLLPPEELGGDAPPPVAEQGPTLARRATRGGIVENAVAGPSRLRN